MADPGRPHGPDEAGSPAMVQDSEDPLRQTEQGWCLREGGEAPFRKPRVDPRETEIYGQPHQQAGKLKLMKKKASAMITRADLLSMSSSDEEGEVGAPPDTINLSTC